MTPLAPPTEACPGCGASFPPFDGDIHPYLGASPACWVTFGQVLAREYADPAYMAAHRTTVDAYAAQHPGAPERRTIQSINLHLVGLYLIVERKLQPAFATKAMQKLTTAPERLRWLEPPASFGAITVADVVQATTSEDHQTLVADWGRSTWDAWAVHHKEIVELAVWLQQAST